ncbi:MAG: hypothetical protein NC350_05900 [Corallococcus sp.]|nr:hypothetical protein [Corallococcus sp.]
MKNVAIIGSGADGLALLSKLRRVLPADYVYYADDTEFYRQDSQAEIAAGVLKIAANLETKYDADTIVVSNAEASFAVRQTDLDKLRADIIVCRPPFKQAEEYSAGGILVATDGVSRRQEERYSKYGKVVSFPELAQLIENDRSDKEVTVYLEECLNNVDFSFDCVVLASALFSLKKHCFCCVHPSAKVFDSVDGAVAGIFRLFKRKKQAKTNASLTFEFAPSEEKNSEKYCNLLQKISKYY